MHPIRIWSKINGKYKPGEKKCSFSGHVRTCSFFQIKTLEKMAANTHRNEGIRKAVDNLIRTLRIVKEKYQLPGVTALILVTAFQAAVGTVFLL